MRCYNPAGVEAIPVENIYNGTEKTNQGWELDLSGNFPTSNYNLCALSPSYSLSIQEKKTELLTLCKYLHQMKKILFSSSQNFLRQFLKLYPKTDSCQNMLISYHPIFHPIWKNRKTKVIKYLRITVLGKILENIQSSSYFTDEKAKACVNYYHNQVQRHLYTKQL